VERRALGPLSITPIGIGTAPIGSDPSWYVYWGPQDERASIAAIHRALDAGVNWVDTAPFYGWGRAEEIVGRAIAGRDDVLLFTKCGTHRNDDGTSRMDLRPESIRAEIEGILRRVRRDHVDLLQLHDVDDEKTPIEETWGAVRELAAEGVIRYGGISNHPAADVERALTVGPVAALQYEYSLLRRGIEKEIVPLAERHGLGILCWSPLASGFLTEGFDVNALAADDFRRRHPFGQLDLARLLDTLRETGRAHDRTAAQVAVAWVLSRPAIAGAIVGIRNEEEASALQGAADLRLTDDELARIEAAVP
jgi:aryl-alcohol dehydrogenase-like predicted oxidoreductase